MKCILCNKEIGKYGNNAMPIKEGSCCDDCNLTKVIPARLARLSNADVKCAIDSTKKEAKADKEFWDKVLPK